MRDGGRGERRRERGGGGMGDLLSKRTSFFEFKCWILEGELHFHVFLGYVHFISRCFLILSVSPRLSCSSNVSYFFSFLIVFIVVHFFNSSSFHLCVNVSFEVCVACRLDSSIPYDFETNTNEPQLKKSGRALLVLDLIS